MKKVLKIFWQVVIDTIVGLATFYILNISTKLDEKDYLLVITLVITSIFAEIWEVKKK